MKPTPQISQNQHPGFPQTDYNFQPAADAKSSPSTICSARKPPAFHKISSEFLGTEMSRDYVAEFSGFTVMAVLSGWMILSNIIAMVRMIRNY
jgi:hypothetical protein